MTAPAADAAAGKEVADGAAGGKSSRIRGPVLERTGGFGAEAGPSEALPKQSRIEKAIESLNKAYVSGADVQLSHDQLEARRLYVLEEAEKVAAAKRELDRSLREYHSAHGLTPVSKQPSRFGLICN